MKRIVYTCLFVFVAFSQLGARPPMRDWLTSMPDSVLPLLTKNNRLDFIDFYDARMEAVVTNRVDGKSRLDTLTADFAHISYTRSASVAMKLLPVNDTTDIFCMVTTVRASVADSRIAFFDAEWQPLEVAACIAEPHIEEFRFAILSDSTQWAWNKMDIFFRTYQLCAEDTNLRCLLTAPDYLTEEERKEVMPYIRHQPLIYHWTGGKYLCHE